jgi:hypothetical protein
MSLRGDALPDEAISILLKIASQRALAMTYQQQKDLRSSRRSFHKRVGRFFSFRFPRLPLFQTKAKDYR